MKKHIFWKILAVLFFIWLCLFLWKSSIEINFAGNIKTNKLTGKTYYLTNDGWVEYKSKKANQSNDSEKVKQSKEIKEKPKIDWKKILEKEKKK